MEIAGTAGKTAAQLAREVAAGGRFVTFDYVYSVVIASFRGQTRAHYVPPDRDVILPAVWPTLFTLAFGWWGLPWGVIFTVEALWVNACGGRDVTDEVMKKLCLQPEGLGLLSPGQRPG